MAGRKNSRVTRFLTGGVIAFLVLPTIVFSRQQPAEDDTTRQWTTLREVQVNALALSNSKFDYGGMIGTISEKKLSVSDPTIASVEINKVPGVYWHSGALNTNRITIRGIGSRSPFSTNKIRAYYGDIPLTDGGGETTLEDIDLGFVGGLEVQKGANSSLYGSGLGGTIFLKEPTIDSSAMETNFSYGSFGLTRAGVRGSVAATDGVFRMGYQSQKSDGYRDNNSFDRQTLFISSNLDFGKNQFSFLGLFVEQRAFIPSSLGITDFNEIPESAAFTWGAARGFEDYERWLAGISWSKDLGGESKLVSSVYTVGRDAFEPRPFNILEEKNYGIGIRSRWETIVNGLLIHAGFEGYGDIYKARTFENLQPTNGSEQGQILTEVKHPRSYLNLFTESRVDLGENILVGAGVNFNITSYEIENSFPSSLDSKNTLNPIASPRLSIIYRLNQSANVFATISHGFSPLSVDDSTNPDGSLNTDIKPETGWNREIGFKHANGRTNLEVSIYSMDIRNLLVTRRTAEDIIFGVNAGRTIHNGLELDIESLVVDRGDNQVVGDVSYSFSHFEFKEFVDDQNDFSGNQLTGVPRHQLNADLSFERKWFFSGIGYQFVGEMPITDGNDQFSDSYQVLNLYAGSNITVSKKWEAMFLLRLNNVFDEKYASMLAINARAFGGSEPRYFYPGLPTNYQASASLRYKL